MRFILLFLSPMVGSIVLLFILTVGSIGFERKTQEYHILITYYQSRYAILLLYLFIITIILFMSFGFYWDHIYNLMVGYAFEYITSPLLQILIFLFGAGVGRIGLKPTTLIITLVLEMENTRVRTLRSSLRSGAPLKIVS